MGSKIGGIAFKIGGIAFTVFGFLFFIVIYRTFILGTGLMGYVFTFILFIFLGFVSVIANQLISRGRKEGLSVLSPKELAKESNIVLYLRSFKDDAIAARYSGIDVRNIASFRPKSFITDEEKIVEELKSAGRVVCIGKPREKLPEIGAERVYAEEKGWRELVSSRMESSVLVVFRIASTEGLLWEVEEALKRVRPERLLFLVPNEKNVYGAFCAAMRDRDLLHLPDYDDTFNNEVEVSGLTGLIYFTHEWKAYSVSFKKKEKLGIALQPIFQQLQPTSE